MKTYTKGCRGNGSRMIGMMFSNLFSSILLVKVHTQPFFFTILGFCLTYISKKKVKPTIFYAKEFG